jgi:hypothetical protein
MTIPTNALTTYGIGTTGGLAEQVGKAMALIDPADTPFWSSLSKDTDNTQGRYIEWIVDNLAAVSPSNKQLEGDTIAAAAVTQPTRMGNYMQISSKAYTISRTADQVRKYGRTKETMRARLNKGKELRRDIEIILLMNAAQDAGSTTTARATGALPSYLTNVVNCSTAPAGTGVGVYASAADTALTYDYLVSAAQLAYQQGGDPSVCFLSPTLKRKFSLLSIGTAVPSTAQVRFNITSAKAKAVAMGTVDVWMSDFGTVEMIPDKIMALEGGCNKSFFLIDPDYVSLAQLQPITLEQLAKVSDGQAEFIVTEYALKVTAPKAHAAGYCLT